LVLTTLRKYKAKPVFPIYYDAEEGSISKKQYEIVITTFNEMLKKAGYQVGVYGNYSAFTYSYLNSKKIKYNKIFSERPTLNDVFLELTGKELRD